MCQIAFFFPCHSTLLFHLIYFNVLAKYSLLLPISICYNHHCIFFIPNKIPDNGGAPQIPESVKTWGGPWVSFAPFISAFRLCSPLHNMPFPLHPLPFPVPFPIHPSKNLRAHRMMALMLIWVNGTWSARYRYLESQKVGKWRKWHNG